MTIDWSELLVRSPDSETDAGAWLRQVGEAMVARADVVVRGAAGGAAGGVPHRIVEVEVYYYGGPHLDPFAHRDPVQRAWGTWYLHRAGASFRAGSFKGIDLTFGAADAFGGVLIRGLETPDGELVSGPSLVVDYLMARLGAPTVGALDARIGATDNAAALATALPVHLAARRADAPAGDPRIWRSARVGLTLKRADAHPDMERYIGRRYRFLTEPRRIRKGRVELVCALHAGGHDARAIARITGSPAAALDRHVAAFEAGRGEPLSTFRGVSVGPRRLARLLGAWHELYGSRTDSDQSESA